MNSTGLVRRAVYALAACCLTGLAVASLASAGGKRVFGVEDCNDPEVKPERIVFACADALHKIKTYSCDGFRARFYRKVKMTFPGPRPPGIEPYVHSELFCA